MLSRPLGVVLQFIAIAPLALANQVANERSIPNPTEIGTAATVDGSIVETVGSPRLIESDKSVAELAVVEVVDSSGAVSRGVRIDLRDDDHHETLYLGADHVAQFRDELAGFVEYFERGGACGAQSRCIHGVARCRPSQTEPQAFCPSFFTTPDGKQGVFLSMPQFSFSFPNVEPSILIDAIDAVTAELELRQAGGL